jgi:hypothetical protein
MLNQRIKISQILFYLNSLIWVGLGIFSLARVSGNTSASPITLWIVALLMFGNAAAMLVNGLILAKRQGIFYIFALVVLGINILLTFTDQFGTLDLITLLIDLILLVMLISVRKAFFSKLPA